MKSDQANRAEQSRNLSHSIRVEILDIASKLIEPQSTALKQLSNDGKKLEKDFKGIIEYSDKVN